MAVGVHRGRHHRLLLGPAGRAGSRDEIAAWLEENFAFVTVSQHFITNIEYSFEGDRAQVRAMFYNPHAVRGGDDRTEHLRRELLPLDGANRNRLAE